MILLTCHTIANPDWNSNSVPGPLSHIKVLDLSRVMAGPWVGQMFADFGADVIKVERPGAGDDTRGWGPPFLKATDGTDTQESGYYLSVNRGKRSLTLNIDKPEGQAIVRKLAARADILLENFKLGTLPRYGLGYDELKKINPRLIYCSITGFGQTGPLAPKVAYDFLIQAMGGLMSITGEADGRPGGGPQKVGIPILDLTTGMYGAVAVLAALANREVTGKGDHIDLAMLDVQAAFLSNQAMNYLLSGRTPRRQGNRHPNIMPQDVFKCRDGEVVLAVGNDGQFAKMCVALKRPELASDPRYIKNADRVRNMDELMAVITEIFAQWSRADLVQALEAVSVPCGPINSIAEVFEQEQIKHRGMRMDLPHPKSGSVPQVANPIKFAATPLEYNRAPPTLGQHSDEILREIGMSKTDITKLRGDGVV
jgi:crotonobetainyl-CoA:carnitine CoA-transferase CaiB-like acyl-CoA transferase